VSWIFSCTISIYFIFVRYISVTVRVLVMLGIYFVSVKYVFVKCKACVCLCETFENLKVQIKRVTFVITEKPRVVFVKYIG
jgi:hypothetical protein